MVTIKLTEEIVKSIAREVLDEEGIRIKGLKLRINSHLKQRALTYLKEKEIVISGKWHEHKKLDVLKATLKKELISVFENNGKE